MDVSQRAIAFLNRSDDDPECDDVGQLFKTDILALHFPPDRIRRLFPTGNFHLDTVARQGFSQLADHPVDQIAAFGMQIVEPADNGFPGIRVQLPKRHVFQFFLPVPDADTFGQWHIDFQRFTRNPPPFVFPFDKMQGLHVVQPVGQLDQQHPDVLRHRQHQLAEIFSLLGARRLQLQHGKFCDAINQRADFRPKG